MEIEALALIAGVRDLGLTGTRQGMTWRQTQVVERILDACDPRKVICHHGDCVGADVQFDILASNRGFRRILHPGHGANGDSTTRQHSEVCRPNDVTCLPPLPYLQRDRIIARVCDLLLATPKEYSEELRSGTWATVRYRRSFRKPLLIIYPDGIASQGLDGTSAFQLKLL